MTPLKDKDELLTVSLNIPVRKRGKWEGNGKGLELNALLTRVRLESHDVIVVSDWFPMMSPSHDALK